VAHLEHAMASLRSDFADRLSNQLRHRRRIAKERPDARVGVGVDAHEAVKRGGQLGNVDRARGRVSAVVVVKPMTAPSRPT
jgi:hypothetical protein